VNASAGGTASVASTTSSSRRNQFQGNFITITKRCHFWIKYLRSLSRFCWTRDEGSSKQY